MEFSKFVEKAVLYDHRNIFSAYDGNLNGIPDALKEFYRKSNPVDVEVNNVRFFPAEDLSDLQEEYSYLNAQFVFASCNGDPIFLQDGLVYTVPHGVEKPKWELLSSNIETYLTELL